MSSAHMASLGIVAYLALFIAVAVAFIFVSLLIGRFVRPSSPSAVKEATYECGEPAVGSSYVQFDLRFYVVALLFIIFDVEVAFFFPWGAVFGKATRLADAGVAVVRDGADGQIELSPEAAMLYRELGVRHPAVPRELRSAAPAEAGAAIKETAKRLAWITIVDIGIFFAVLLVGFAYVWNRGDLEWVRAIRRDGLAGSAAGPATAA